MNVAPTSPSSLALRPDGAKPRTPEEAAQAFETVLVREFVRVMTKDLFKSSLAGGGPLAAGQADLQRDQLTDLLTAQLVDGNALRLRDLLLRQWARTGAPAEAAAPPPATNP